MCPLSPTSTLRLRKKLNEGKTREEDSGISIILCGKWSKKRGEMDCTRGKVGVRGDIVTAAVQISQLISLWDGLTEKPNESVPRLY